MKGFFRGVATAMPTPFLKGKIDYSTLEKLIDSQMSAKIDALVFLGTTGEPCSLSERERSDVFRFAVEKAKGKTKLIFGAGSNDTKTAVSLAKKAEKAGADGLLVVTPFYNKCTQKGLIKHYEAICSNVDIPVLAYNVPSRTGVNLTIEQIDALSECENVVAIKEASDSMDKYAALAGLRNKIGLYAGNDSHFYQVLSLGGIGVISVLSNAIPSLMVDIYEKFLAGDRFGALDIQSGALGLISSLFSETNPAPISLPPSRFQGRYQ